MRTIAGVLLGAVGVVIGGWYLRRTDGRLLPAGLTAALRPMADGGCTCPPGRAFTGSYVRAPGSAPGVGYYASGSV